MDTERDFDFVIAGFGLAGCFLARELLNRRNRVCVIDPLPAFSSSRVAAGIYNPITGKRFVKSWKADELLITLIRTFEKGEGDIRRFIFHLKILRAVRDNFELNQWMGKIERPEYKSHCRFVAAGKYEKFIWEKKGYLEIFTGGYVETAPLLDCMAEIIRTHTRGAFFRGELGYSSVHSGGDKVFLSVSDYSSGQITNLVTKKLVFCEGYHVKNNPFFCRMPVIPVKGEILEIEAENFHAEHIIVDGIYLLPAGEHKFIVGSNYERGAGDAEPTEKTRSVFEEKLRGLLKCRYKVTNHWAGIRPTTPDRRPVAGEHPSYKNLCILNGLGTKGVMLAPYMSEKMADFLLEGKPLPQETDCRRFF